MFCTMYFKLLQMKEMLTTKITLKFVVNFVMEPHHVLIIALLQFKCFVTFSAYNFFGFVGVSEIVMLLHQHSCMETLTTHFTKVFLGVLCTFHFVYFQLIIISEHLLANVTTESILCRCQICCTLYIIGPGFFAICELFCQPEIVQEHFQSR